MRVGIFTDPQSFNILNNSILAATLWLKEGLALEDEDGDGVVAEGELRG